MLQLASTSTFRPQRIETLPTLPPRTGLTSAVTAPAALNEELLPFTVKVVSTKAQLANAVQIRHDAYARHLPEFAETLLKLAGRGSRLKHCYSTTSGCMARWMAIRGTMRRVSASRTRRTSASPTQSSNSSSAR